MLFKQKSGFITLFGKIHETQLIFEIVDNGDGFDTNQKKKTRTIFLESESRM